MNDYPEIMTMAEMRKAVRDGRREHLKPASKLGKQDLISELQTYRAKAKAGSVASMTPVTGSLEKEAKASVTVNVPNTSVQEKRLQALAKAREARKKNLEAKHGTPSAEKATEGVQKKKSQPQPVKMKYDDLFIY